MIDDIFKTHKRVVFFYSGGKDSLAVLMLLKNHLDKVDVVWINPGAPFPEVVEHMKKVRDFVPRFTEVRSDVMSFINDHGHPVDVVDTRRTAFGNFAFGPTDYKVCSRFDCCGHNMWRPMAQYIVEHGVDCVIRADRGEERAKGRTTRSASGRTAWTSCFRSSTGTSRGCRRSSATPLRGCMSRVTN